MFFVHLGRTGKTEHFGMDLTHRQILSIHNGLKKAKDAGLLCKAEIALYNEIDARILRTPGGTTGIVTEET